MAVDDRGNLDLPADVEINAEASMTVLRTLRISSNSAMTAIGCFPLHLEAREKGVIRPRGGCAANWPKRFSPLKRKQRGYAGCFGVQRTSVRCTPDSLRIAPKASAIPKGSRTVFRAEAEQGRSV